MRVAYVGNFQPAWSTENDVRLALEHLGHEVVALQENRVRPEGLRQVALSSDLLLWTGTWDNAQPLDQTLNTFAALAKVGIPSATLHLDTFWATDRGGRRWWLNPMFHTSHLFTADGDHQDKWERFGKRHTWLRPGVRHTVVEQPGTSRPQYACDVAFVGSDGRNYHPEWPYRRELVNQVEAMCDSNGWVFRNPGGRHPKVDRQHMADFCASAKVIVGDSLCPLKEASQYWSDRVYEITGRCGLLIMPEINALVSDFDGHLPTYRWGDWTYLEEEIEHYVNGDLLRTSVAHQCQKFTAERHTYVHRMQEMLDYLGLT